VIGDQIANMSPGEVLLDVPMGAIIERTARAIADAQFALDDVGIRTAALLGETRVEFRDAAGAVTRRSLLELGFTPAFYSFVETTIDVKVTMSMKVEESVGAAASVSFGTVSTTGTGSTGTATGTSPSTVLPSTPFGPTGPPRSSGGTTATRNTSSLTNLSGLARPGTPSQDATMFGITLSADYHRRYEFNTSASSSVTTKMVSVPPPSAFLDALRESLRVTVG
jgi:hypothetical protein